jgi:Winged helix DNA-binding domain
MERRARLAIRHGLAVAATGPENVATSLVAVHSSDPSGVFLAMWSRIPGFTVDDLERALYEDRSLVRHWAMRRTLWVAPRELLPALIASSTNPIGRTERRRTIKIIEDGGVAADGDAWLEEVLPKTLDAIRANGEMFTRNLTALVPELSDKVTFTDRAGRVVGTTGMASRALVQLGMESRVVRSRPAGSWVSGQYSWAVIEDWLGQPLAQLDVSAASAEVAHAYLRSFGPVTETDLRWWTGWPAARARAALTDVGAVEVDLEDAGVGYLGPNDLEEVGDPGPWVAFLPSLDSTTMGWKNRDWYLGEHAPVLFDRNGNAGPTVWVDGKVVGGWAQRRDGEVVYELLEDVGTDAREEIESRGARLRAWLGDVTVTPRFRSPHDRRLAP